MSRDSEDFDVQPGSETDLLSDPTYIQWTARLEGEGDQEKGISLSDGLGKLRTRGASLDEIAGYYEGFTSSVIFTVARDAGIPVPPLSAQRPARVN